MTLQDNKDPDDPWTFFGQFSKIEVSEASRLLGDAKIKFEIKEGTFDPKSGWSGPFGLWVHDENAAQAEALLTPYFASREQGAG
jgi:hypothetical protein